MFDLMNCTLAFLSLQEYAALQRFTPFRSEHAKCMNWERMIAEFSFPLPSPNYVRGSRPDAS
jgi:hypothetical protein